MYICIYFSDFNPYFGTDYGICSIIKPQLAFDRNLDSIPYWEKLFGVYNWNVSKGAQVGKANGLSMLLDAETFDYTFHLKAGEGFKIAVHHHLDQPIMSIKELDISPGSVFQVTYRYICKNTFFYWLEILQFYLVLIPNFLEPIIKNVPPSGFKCLIISDVDGIP